MESDLPPIAEKQWQTRAPTHDMTLDRLNIEERHCRIGKWGVKPVATVPRVRVSVYEPPQPLWFFILSMAAFAVLCLWLTSAHAAIHTDRPTQETAPVASKPQVCTAYLLVMTRNVGEDGKVHRTVYVVPVQKPC